VATKQCCKPPPNAAMPRDFQTPPPPQISVADERREIENLVAINLLNHC
jgi:hypothetical protein